MSRYVSVLMKMEVEVVDPAALDGLLLDDHDDAIPDDDPEQSLNERRQGQVAAAIWKLRHDPSGRAELSKSGFVLRHASCSGRWLRDGVYDEVTIGLERARNDDGTLVADRPGPARM